MRDDAGARGGHGRALFGYTNLYGAVPGGQAEYLRVPQAQNTTIKVPDGPADERFVYLSDVLPTAWQGVEYAGIPDGGTVVVLGLGPIGEMASRIAAHKGFRVIGVDLVPERLEREQARGIEVFDLSEHEDDLGDVIREMTDGRGPDSVIDAVGMEAHGSPVGKIAHQMVGLLPDVVGEKIMEKGGVDRLNAFYLAIDIVRRGGTISLSGVYGGEADPLPMLTLFDKQIQLRMGQANVKKWVDDIMPLLDRRGPARRGDLPHAQAAARSGARGVREVPEEAGRLHQGPAPAVVRPCRDRRPAGRSTSRPSAGSSPMPRTAPACAGPCVLP